MRLTLPCALLLMIACVAACTTQALAIERASPFGNAASVYTTSGANADYFAARFRAGMIGKCTCY
jgi:acyl-CoA reductase-like NAD-dependent aldehyde dehydrogenase